jgi:hypothetical protein
MENHKDLSTVEKALEINLDHSRYGTFAEIGAGQEVVRWFFQAGGQMAPLLKVFLHTTWSLVIQSMENVNVT